MQSLVQEVFLSGRENQVGSSAQAGFQGTLKERRMKYQDRRVVQGQDSDRHIKRMRELAGLEHDAPGGAAPVRPRPQVAAFFRVPWHGTHCCCSASGSRTDRSALQSQRDCSI